MKKSDAKGANDEKSKRRKNPDYPFEEAIIDTWNIRFWCANEKDSNQPLFKHISESPIIQKKKRRKKSTNSFFLSPNIKYSWERRLLIFCIFSVQFVCAQIIWLPMKIHILRNSTELIMNVPRPQHVNHNWGIVQSSIIYANHFIESMNAKKKKLKK